MDSLFLNRIELARESNSWMELNIGFNKNKGTVDCPFCFSKNKGYLYEYYFKCFSSKCNVKGDKLSIYQKIKQCSFYEALLFLENIGNIDIEVQQEFYTTRTEFLSSVLSAYNNELNKDSKAQDYLFSRGFTPDFIKQEEIGYAPTNNVLKDYSININALRRHNLANTTGEFLFNRIIFPVYNLQGHLVHLTGRFFPGECTEYKYLDTKAIPIINSCKDYLLFEKHIQLYKNNKKVLFLVEGVGDAYILKQSGCNVVGLMGLAKILKQSNKIQDFNTIIAVFDNDRFEVDHPHFPGQFKSWRIVLEQLVSLQLYLGKEVLIKTVMVPEGLSFNNNLVKDINDFYLYLECNSSNLIRELNSLSKDIVEHYIELHKGDMTYHKTAAKLINATNRGFIHLEKFIPADLTPLQYVLKILGD